MATLRLSSSGHPKPVPCLLPLPVQNSLSVGLQKSFPAVVLLRSRPHACAMCWADVRHRRVAAQVYKAIKDGVTPVAVKVFPSNATDVQQEEFQREVVILKSCRDRNIVQFLGACVEAGQTFLVTGALRRGVSSGRAMFSAGRLRHDFE